MGLDRHQWTLSAMVAYSHATNAYNGLDAHLASPPLPQ